MLCGCITIRRPQPLHWCIPNVYSTAIELECGRSPITFVIVECKAQHSGEWKQQQHRTSLNELSVQHKCTVMGEMNEISLQLPVYTLQAFALYKVHQIGRAVTGEHTLLEGGLVNDHTSSVAYGPNS